MCNIDSYFGCEQRTSIGPLVQVSRDFHAQFKGDFLGEVIHGGYAADADYMEVVG